MSQPDHESIVNEIRSARITASPELRARVRAIAATAPDAVPARRRRPLPWRRLTLVVVPAAVAVALAVSLAVGLRDSGSNGSRNAVQGEVGRGAEAKQRSGRHVRGALRQERRHRRRRRPARHVGPGAALRGRADAEDRRPVGRDQARAPPDPRLPRLRAQRRVRLRHRARLRVSRRPRPRRQRPGGAGALLGARADPRPARLDQGRPAAGRPAVPADAGAARPDREAPGAAREPVARLGRAHGAREPARRRAPAARRSSRSSRRRCSARRPTRPSRSSCGPRTRRSSSRTSRAGSAARSTASGQIVADEAKVLVYVLVVGAPFFVLGALALGGFSVRRRRREERLLATS